MTTLWAIEVTPPWDRRKPWIAHYTVRALRKDAWNAYREVDGHSAWWSQEIKRRQRKGLLRAVKVTIQLAEEKS